jgi:dihydrofolate reductase
MRKIIVFNIISRDGCHMGPDNEVSVMFPMTGGVFDTYNAELLRTADLHLVGRISFELFQSFCPKVAESPNSEEWTPEQKELSEAGSSVKAVVVPDRLTGNWRGIRIIRRADNLRADCRAQTPTGQRVLITGSRTLWNDLLAQDLLDEIHLMVGNIVLGEGVPVFVGKPHASLRLIDVRTWEHSDNVLLRYEVRAAGAARAAASPPGARNPGGGRRSVSSQVRLSGS